MSQDLSSEDWQQIALFYQKKFADLEMQVLQLELAQNKAQAAEAEEPAKTTSAVSED